MQLARLGEIGAIQKLFDRGFCDAKYADEQGITPLHVGIIFLGVEALESRYSEPCCARPGC